VWAEYRAVAPSIFAPTFGAFRSRYTRPALRSEWRDTDVMVTAGRGGELSRWKMDDVAHLEAEVYRCAHRVRVVDVLDLPESSDVVVEASLEKEASRIYDEIQADFIADVSSSSSSPVVVTAVNAMVVALRLAQVTGGTLRDDAGGSHVVSVAKRDALTEYLEGMAGEPVVIFGRFRADLDAIHQAAAAAGLSSSELSGRRSELAAWQRGDTCVLVAQVAAGSVGIDLTRARVAVWYSLSYNLAEYIQSRARVLRPGQTRAVVFAHVIAKGTIDEGVYRALEARGDVVAAIVDGVVATSRRLPTVRA
jgi:SNF2 family DNA or RNA helicase